MHEVEKVEEKWLDTLFEFCKKTFNKTHIPSHDETHHFRAWLIAKNLILTLRKNDVEVPRETIEELIIAIFFHDIGLTVTYDEKHGLESRKICEKYFDTHPKLKPKNLDNILYAIEHHDEKDYKNKAYDNEANQTTTFTLLCVSDDLDAFGYVGILRYAEIYLLRGISKKELAKKVLTNLASRYENFENSLGQIDDVLQTHKKRYEITKSFYENLENKAEKETHVINYLVKHVIEEKKDFAKLTHHVLNTSKDNDVTDFFTHIKKELHL